MKKSILGAFAIATIAGLTLAGCGSDPLGNDGGSGTEGSPSNGALTPISVVVAPIQFESAYIAERQGFFEEEGLDVEIVRGADPTSNIARVVSGEVDITTGSLGTLITAASAGVPVVAIAGNGYTSAETATSGIISLAASDIKTPADLAGKKVGIQGLNTGSEIPMFLAAKAFDIDPLSIERVELASPGMETALLEGTIDAVLASAPYYGQLMKREDVHLVSNPSTEYMAGTPVTMWTVTKQWADQNAETAEAFVRAMQKAEAYYVDPANTESILDITAEVSDVDRATLTAAALIPVSVAIDEAQAAVQADGFTTFGIVKSPVTIDQILWSGAPLR